MRASKRASKIASHFVAAQSEELVLPIFVCNLAFPQVETKLHIFEPRYRLMIQHSLKHNRLFGMTISTLQFPEIAPNDLTSTTANNEGMCDMGTVVRIKEHRTLPDGRILIEIIGVARFRILEITVVEQIEKTTNEPASYYTARCEVYNDSYDMLSSEIDQTRQKMKSLCSKFRRMWPHPISVFFFQKLLGEEGFVELAAGMQETGNTIPEESKASMPTVLDDPEALFWRAVDALPIPERHKYYLLSSPSTEERMGLLLQLLDAVQEMSLPADEGAAGGPQEGNPTAPHATKGGTEAEEDIID
jgi:Lon protease-like protein